MKEFLLRFYRKHEILVGVLVFLAGFLFDLLTLRRIDDFSNLLKQGIYLLLLGALITSEIKFKLGTLKFKPKLKNFWEYHNLVIHFLFGTLLRSYTIFYYTSASAIASFIYIALLACLMLANEVPRIQKLGVALRVMLYSICVISFFLFFYPILLGHMEARIFWYAFLSSAIVLFFFGLFYLKANTRSGAFRRQILIPAIGIHLLFLLGHATSSIPPVPVAIKKIGVYHLVEKNAGKYIGSHLRTNWDPLRFGPEKFLAREGDKITVLLSIFSPNSFQDQIFLKWFFYDGSRWRLEDSIPLTILGGRQEGFRGFGTKQFYRPGQWRIIVETSDEREVGRINVEIKKDLKSEERIFKKDVF